MAGKGVLSHIEINVSNLQETSLFWRWFLEELGYTEFQRWDSGVSWKLGKTYIVFVQTAKKHSGSKYHRCQTGLNHLAFSADSKADVDQISDKLRGKGVNILYYDRHPNTGGPNNHSVYFEDPNRIKVEYVFYSE